MSCAEYRTLFREEGAKYTTYQNGWVAILNDELLNQTRDQLCLVQCGLALCNERESLHNGIDLLPHDDIGIVKLGDRRTC